MLAPHTFQPQPQRWERYGVQPLAPLRHQSPLKNRRRSDDVIVREHHVPLQEDQLLSLDYNIAFVAEFQDLNDPAELDNYSCWRSVCLRELTYIPIEEREETDILGRSYGTGCQAWDRASASRLATAEMEAMNAALHCAWPFAQTQHLSWEKGAGVWI